LNPLPIFNVWRRGETSAAKIYGSIVAQARLPAFYQGFGVPDTLEGRFVVLSLQLFAVLHRLKSEGEPAQSLIQELIDRFGADMETVLREVGVGDLSVPKKVRALAASGSALFHAYEDAFAKGDAEIARTISETLLVAEGARGAVAERLAHYLGETFACLQAQDFSALQGGEVRFPTPLPEPGLGENCDA
jgi:cytochrome b pre-mRNA-processing protein 3